ncbi:hypothetical protein EVA_15294, partial [gut metagenome]
MKNFQLQTSKQTQSVAFLPLRKSHKGPANKVEVYAPLEKPTSIAKAK